MVDKKKISFWRLIAGGILIGLAVGFFFIWFDSDNEEYSNCVDDCVLDFKDCVSNSILFDKLSNGYIPENEFEMCFTDWLEYCSEDCKP